MKVRELIDLLSKVKNQDLDVFLIRHGADEYDEALAAPVLGERYAVSVVPLNDGGEDFDAAVIFCSSDDLYGFSREDD